ncbi:MAG: trypsin-like peptidase domain-containing protein [Myxococcota bacterium]
MTLRRRAACVMLAGLLAGASSCRRIEDDEGQPIFVAEVVDSPPTGSDPPPATPAPVRTIVVPDFADVAADVGPSVVTVIATVPQQDGNRNKVVRGLGSGMIVSASGEILTNEHVIASATRVDVELSTRERIPARVKVSEPLLDLALLQLETDLSDLQPVEFEPQTVRPGQWVMAVGQPFGLGDTVTVGVIGGLGRDHRDLGRPDGLDPGGYWNFIQTDASINIGNSGGPLVNASGRVVGITTAVRSDGQGLAFATPAPMAQRFLDEARTFGRVRKTRLGINANDVPNPGRGPGTVVQITKVEAGSPGARAELTEGDIIERIEDRPVSRVSDVAYLTQLSGVGRQLTFTIRRGDDLPRDVELVPDERG